MPIGAKTILLSKIPLAFFSLLVDNASVLEARRSKCSMRAVEAEERSINCLGLGFLAGSSLLSVRNRVALL
jgi:hypothetical protein